MSRKFKIDRYPYDDDIKMYEKTFITLEPGATVLVGCNGSGKTTLLQMIERSLKRDRIPVLYLDTLQSAQNGIGNAIFSNNLQFAATSYIASEGERMALSIGQFAGKIKEFIATGKRRRTSMEKAFAPKEKPVNSNERWILIDSADSGLSIDMLEEVRDLINLVIEDNKEGDKELYIVLSTNQYEMVVGNRCLDVQTLKPVVIKTYDRYRSVIRKSRERKEARNKQG